MLKVLMGAVASSASLTALLGVFMLRPAGQVNLDLDPNDYAFLVDTRDNSLTAADFNQQSLGSQMVSGQTIFIPRYWQTVAPGWGPGTRKAIPSARLFVAKGIRQSVKLELELDTLDVVNVTIPLELTVMINNQQDAALYLTAAYGALADDIQEGVEVRPDVTEYLTQQGGQSRIKAAVQRVYGQVPLKNLDAQKSGLLADAKREVTKELQQVGITVTEFSYGGDYKLNDVVTQALTDRRNSLTELQQARKEVETAQEQATAVAARNKAFGTPEEALKNRCVELTNRYITEVINPAVSKGLFKDVESAPSELHLGVPTPKSIFEDFGCGSYK